MKKTLVLAGSLMAGLLFFSAQAKAQFPLTFSGSYGKINYSGRYSCHGFSTGNGNTTGAWVVNPDGRGGYNDGVLCVNFDPKRSINGCDCTFQLLTDHRDGSSYTVDPTYGIVSESLVWKDETSGRSADTCSDSTFTDLVVGAMVAAGNSPQPASQTLFTDNNLDTAGSYPGHGNCVLGGTIPFSDRD
jgi:hypothetical protein